KIEDRRSGQVVHVPITITYAMTLVEGITLSQTTLNLKPNDTQSLIATVLPENADNKTVTWQSSDESVATVSADGLVTAKAAGSCVITCSATDGSGVKGECQVTVTSGTIPDEDNHEYVDLGLPSGTLWATCNVGASKPEEYGDYFAWGETKPKSDYLWDTYKWGSGYNQLTKYCNDSDYGLNGFIDNRTTLDLADDAAHANWGGQWRMPTSADFDELLNNTSNQWVTNYNGTGVNGRLFTANNGKSIFLPAAGNRSGTSLYYAGSNGFYWSSSLYSTYPYRAYKLYFGSSIVDVDYYYANYNDYRYYGRTVRPVRPKN
ncbi:MAG: Ig-like domain-containing protein, partial [Alloprevotella sp.]|nr:Ig-like domain-containing protein [Alloprevotella sp.]